jgi:trigger factor
LKKDLALATVAKQESITVDEQEIAAESAKVMEQLKGQEVDPDRLREVVTEDLLKQKTIKWLEENGTVELVPQETLTTESEAAKATETTAETETEAVGTSENPQQEEE